MSKLLGIQVLRGVAATLVAGFHLYAAALNEGADPGLFRVFAGGEIGVDIFFVISGFIIYFVSQNRPNMTAMGFMRARFWRIFPPYWVILTLYVLAAVALAVVLNETSNLPDLSSLIVSYLLLPYPDHIIIIAWTLSIELLFYGVFALTFFAGGTRRLMVAMILWVIVTQIALHFAGTLPLWTVIFLHSAVLEFLFGILLAILFVKAPNVVRQYRALAMSIGLLGVGFYLFTGGWTMAPFGREISAGVPAAFLVLGTLGYSFRFAEPLEVWGESSYILYLIHLLYFSIVGKVVELAFGINVYASVPAMLALLISVVALCCLATVWFERPYQKWYRPKLGLK